MAILVQPAINLIFHEMFTLTHKIGTYGWSSEKNYCLVHITFFRNRIFHTSTWKNCYHPFMNWMVCGFNNTSPQATQRDLNGMFYFKKTTTKSNFIFLPTSIDHHGHGLHHGLCNITLEHLKTNKLSNTIGSTI